MRCRSTVWAACLVQAVAACDSDSPAAPSAHSSLALHIDSLAAREANSSNVEWFNLLVEINSAVARGVKPETVTITVNGGTVVFDAIAVKWLDTVEGHSPTALDSAWTLVAWTGGRDPHSILAVPVGDGVSVPPVRYFADTSSRFVADSAAFAITSQTFGGACSLTTVRYLGFPLTKSCEQTTTKWSVTVRAPPLHLSMPPQSVAGVRIFID